MECATCRPEYDLLAQGREKERGTIKWDSSVAKLGQGCWVEWTADICKSPWQLQSFKNNNWFKKSNCPGSSRKWEPGTVPPSPDLENSTLKQVLGSLSLTGLLKHPRWHPISGLCTGGAGNWDSFSLFFFFFCYLPSFFINLLVSRWPPQSGLLQGHFITWTIHIPSPRGWQFLSISKSHDPCSTCPGQRGQLQGVTNQYYLLAGWVSHCCCHK